MPSKETTVPPAPESSTAPDSTVAAIVVKKYGNRRLYNTLSKQYINLDDIKTLIQQGHQVQILDSKTHEDLTQSILIQLILEQQKESDTPLFSNEFLHQLLQQRQDQLAEFFQDYVPQLLAHYQQWQTQWLNWTEQQWSSSHQFFNPWQPLTAAKPETTVIPPWPQTPWAGAWPNPFSWMTPSAKPISPSGPGQKGKISPQTTDSHAEIEALKAQLADLEARLQHKSSS